MPDVLRRRWWPKSLAGKAGVCLLFMAIVLVSSYFAAKLYTSKRLAEAWRLSEAFDLSNDIVKLLGPQIPSDQNAAIPLDQAGGLASKRVADAQQKHNLIERDDAVRRVASFDESESLANDRNYEAFLQAADDRPGYRSQVMFAEQLAASDFRYLMNRSQIAEIEVEIGRQLVAGGRPEAAARRLLRLSRIFRKWEAKEPFMISSAVNVGGRGKIIAALNAVLRTDGRMAPLVHDEIEAEFAQYEVSRAAGLWLGHTETLLQITDLEQNRSRLLRASDLAWDHAKTQMLIHAHRINDAWDQPFFEAKERVRAINRESAEFQQTPLGRLVGRYPTNGIAFHIRNSFDRLLARARCLRIVNAWSRRGDFTVQFDALSLPTSAFADPFDGKTMRVKRTPTGPIIYSVSDDLNDNGGDVGDKPSDQGLAPIGFQPETP